MRLIIFLLGLAAIDYGVKFAGYKLKFSPYWDPPAVATKFASAKNRDVLIIGGCRAALNIDPEILKNKLNLNVFNAGKVVEGLGNIEFTLDVALPPTPNKKSLPPSFLKFEVA